MRYSSTLWDAISLLAGGKLPRLPRANEWSARPEQWRDDKQRRDFRPVSSTNRYLLRRSKL
ncbi:MAG: hypothetical protein ABI690_28290 [Chloroflexota bacterium]